MSEQSLYQCICSKCKDKFFHEDKHCPICQLCHALDRCETLCKQLTAAQSRVVELEREVLEVRGYLTVSNASAERRGKDNARLRELLQTYKHKLDARWREGTRVDSYARGYQDGLEAAEVIFDDVFKAAIESQHHAT